MVENKSCQFASGSRKEQGEFKGRPATMNVFSYSIFKTEEHTGNYPPSIFLGHAMDSCHPDRVHLKVINKRCDTPSSASLL